MVFPLLTSENLWPFPVKGDVINSAELEDFEDLEELADDEDDCLDLKEIEAWVRANGNADDFPKLNDVRLSKAAKRSRPAR